MLFETIRTPVIRLIVALVHGITKEAVPSEIRRHIFCIVGGGFVGSSALARLANSTVNSFRSRH